MLIISTFLKTFSKNNAINRIIHGLCKASIIINQSIQNDKYKPEKISLNVGGDIQKPLDLFSDKTLLNYLNINEVAAYCSEEQKGITNLNHNGEYIVVTDPLDGSSNIESNVTIGTIFSVIPRNGLSIQDAIYQKGCKQSCSGFFVYGPKTTLILTFKEGTHSFFLNYNSNNFELLNKDISIPIETSEYSINSSYKRPWNESVSNYIKNCELGKDGPRKRDFNMRWVGSLVADASRIFSRGGIFLYPQDKRKTNINGRLRLTYEANPIALLIEEAGGKASDGVGDILKKKVINIHQRTPFIFGSKEEVYTFLNTE